MRYLVTILLLASLSACGDPLAGIEKIDDVELADAGQAPQALPTAEDTQATGGFLSRLIAPKPTQVDADVAGQAVETPADATSADSIEDVAVRAAISDAQSIEPLVETTTPEPTGIRGWLRRSADRAKAEESKAAASVAPAPEVVEANVVDVAVQPETAIVVSLETNTPTEAPDVSVEPEKRKGLLGIFKPAQAGTAKETVPVRTASLSPDLDVASPQALANPEPQVAVEPKKRRGLFGGEPKIADRNGPDARDVDYGTVIRYGEVARVCAARGRTLGRKIDKAPARGRGYALYDSDPNSASARTFYVTGFADGCPRQFTAALALLGAPTLHEQLRYGRPSSEYPYSTTDKAYEKVKSAVCRVGKRKPCGAKISELEKNTVFISTYERFGGNSRWADILIHDGAVLAAAIKTP